MLTLRERTDLLTGDEIHLKNLSSLVPAQTMRSSTMVVALSPRGARMRAAGLRLSGAHTRRQSSALAVNRDKPPGPSIKSTEIKAFRTSSFWKGCIELTTASDVDGSASSTNTCCVS